MFKLGQHVRWKPKLFNEDYDLTPEEFELEKSLIGVIMEYDPDDHTVIVQLPTRFLEEDDDGVREMTDDEVEIVDGKPTYGNGDSRR